MSTLVHRLTSVQLAGVLGLVALGVAGCGNELESTVSGRVTFDGKPVPQAIIVFHPTQGPVAYGLSDDDGNYNIQTASHAGLLKGAYTVSVSAEAKPAQEGTAADPFGTPAVSLLPAKYTDHKQSGLKCTINAGDNEFDIDLPADS